MIVVGTCIRLKKNTHSSIEGKIAIAMTSLVPVLADESLLPELFVWVIRRDITPLWSNDAWLVREPVKLLPVLDCCKIPFRGHRLLFLPGTQVAGEDFKQPVSP